MNFPDSCFFVNCCHINLQCFIKSQKFKKRILRNYYHRAIEGGKEKLERRKGRGKGVKEVKDAHSTLEQMDYVYKSVYKIILSVKTF
ncbi:MAG: hypothetical protein LBI70_00450 [Rickettsiales bacterium]|nr:hypothetical protein [Rickettsiales bacterium]